MRTPFRTLAVAAAASLSLGTASAQSWTSSHPPQPNGIISYAAAVAKQGGQNQIFVFGGTDGMSSEVTVQRFHRTNGWSLLGNMPAGRLRGTATTVEIGGQDYVHLFGGAVGGTGATTTNWRYDPVTDTWDAASFAPMPVAKAEFEAVTAPNGRIYVFGGRNASGSVTYATLDIYDPIGNAWSPGPTMPIARTNFAALKDCDGYIYLYGGFSGGSNIAQIDCFDTVTGTWLATNPHTGGAFPAMPTPRSNVAGALGRNGRHYITGGNVASPVAVPTVEAFNPYTNTWTTEPSMLQSRNSHRAVGLGTRIWVMGGYRKIWPTTDKLESFGWLGNYGPCGNDVPALPPIIIGHTFAEAVALARVESIVGGVVPAGGSDFYTWTAGANERTAFRVESGAAQGGHIIRLYDGQRNLLEEAPGHRGVLVKSDLSPATRYFIEVADAGGSAGREYDLYVSGLADPQPIGEVYCTPAVPNSTGDPAGIAAEGLTDVDANAVRLSVTGLPPQTFGFFVVSPLAGEIVNPGGSMGVLCVTGSQIGRYAGNVLNSGPNGRVGMSVDLSAIPIVPVTAVQPGETWHFTYWFRDLVPNIGATSNFSDGVAIGFN